MLWTILVVLLILWLLGFSFHVGGALIHLLLVIAVVVLGLQPDSVVVRTVVILTAAIARHKFVHEITWNEKGSVL